MASPAPLTEIGSFGVRTRKRPASSDAIRSIASAGVSSVCSEVTSTARGPSACSASIAASASRQRRARAAGEMIELELVRRHDIGRRHRLVAHEFRNARPHEDAAPDIADHRIAAIARLRVGAPSPARPHRGSPRRSRPSPCSRRARRRSRPSTPRSAMPCTTSRISAAVEHAAASRRHSRCGWRTARCGSARPRRRAAAAETSRRRCRHGRRRRATGSRGCSCAAVTNETRREHGPAASNDPTDFRDRSAAISDAGSDQDAATLPYFALAPARRTCWCRSSTGRCSPWRSPATDWLNTVEHRLRALRVHHAGHRVHRDRVLQRREIERLVRADQFSGIFAMISSGVWAWIHFSVAMIALVIFWTVASFLAIQSARV